jgi:predicted dienelactone hydrolase
MNSFDGSIMSTSSANILGYREGMIADPDRPAWRRDEPRPIGWSAWYPAAADARVEPAFIGSPDQPFFILGPQARDAEPAGDKLPVAIVSHGTGGSAVGFHWLARRLVADGWVVIGPNHHGNTTLEPYYPEGFLAWWERARDLTLLLDWLGRDSFLAGRIDLSRVAAIGFSLGTHSVLGLLGARTDMAQFRTWALSQPEEMSLVRRGPREFPDLADQLDGLLENSPIFRASWDRQGIDYTDARITAAALYAPAPPVRGLTEASLRGISAPVQMLVGDADLEAPPEHARWLKAFLPQASLEILTPGISHYVFLPVGTERSRATAPEVFADPPGVDRAAIHREVAEKTAEFLRQSAGP